MAAAGVVGGGALEPASDGLGSCISVPCLWGVLQLTPRQ